MSQREGDCDMRLYEDSEGRAELCKMSAWFEVEMHYIIWLVKTFVLVVMLGAKSRSA